MSENVKINIFEKDNTSPAGSGIDSTDIAFVPGFSILLDAPKNKPTLVTTTREFEKLFGNKPRILTHEDVRNYTQYGFIAGDFDRSYVYAKELLFQGMPIVYSNIVSKDMYTETDIVANSASLGSDSTIPSGAVKCTNTDKLIQFEAIKAVEGEFTLTFKKTLEIAAADGNTPTTSTFEFSTDTENCEITSFIVSTNDITTKYSEITTYTGYDQLVEFTNKTEIAEEVTAVITLKGKLNLKMGGLAFVKLTEKTGSVLDAFYGDEKVINTQWDISGDDSIADKSIYSVKYITSGGYPSVVSNDSKSVSQKFSADMLAAAAHRGEAVALIDYQLAPDERVFSVETDSASVYAKMHAAFNDVANAEYGAAMYPWSSYNCGSTLSFTDSQMIEMPASFGYLMCVAKAIKSSPNWLAMAGVTRGLVPGINKLLVPGNVISNAIAEEMQPKFGVENHRLSINTITNIRPYGLTLWGNRTLKPVAKDGTVALNFLNTRNMLSDIKKLLYTTAKSCMFEQNSSDLWIKFKSGIEPLLRRLKAGNGISDYQIVRGNTKYNGDPLTKGEIAAVIKVYPMYAVEYFELAVEINDEEVTVS